MNSSRAVSFRQPVRIVAALFLLCSLAACSSMNSYLPDMGGESPDRQTYRKPTAKEAGVIKTARSVKGRRYKWGGDSPAKGFDCSGLIFWVYRSHGIPVPRVSWEQYRAGRFVEKGDIRPGDIVFYKVQTGKSIHVGIVTEKGTFIHSPRSGKGVTESDMNNPFWREHYVGARRLL
ncbi:C40 family peptidase [Salidesulfovibrio onnuriiensis]|uniref:C40 family peptidase n=1 Tax=Salidesulfovibrio onnuriiensis TaxID=2583823 RepID=UPI0011C74C97|nr:C40 family peptidase [Salidesulfovibrio onnuriiensis]